MIKYLAFLNDGNIPFHEWPAKCIEVLAENVFDAYSQIVEKHKVAFITVSEDDVTYDYPDGQVYSRYYLDNPTEFETGEEFPF